MVDFRFEAEWPGPVAGVDEAGRGPLAGPVVAAAVILDPATAPEGLADSKTLTAARREALFEAILERALAFAICEVDAGEIDRINILQATMRAMAGAVEALALRPCTALIDGNRAPTLSCRAVTLIKGDALSASIAAASILAKVTRDRHMIAADTLYPGYGFAQHKGYPSPLHLEQLRRLGPSPIHRMSFAPVRQATEAMRLRLPTDDRAFLARSR